jgi:glycosyltransferase involved in cell wall biosynthesis
MKLTKKVVIVGKNPPPFYGTSIWFETLQKTDWSSDFELIFFDNRANKNLHSLGKFSIHKLFRNINLYFQFSKLLKKEKPDLVLIPFSQTTVGFVKDSIFIKIAKKRVKTLLMLHGANFKNWSSNARLLTKKYIQSTFRNTKGIVVLGENLKNLFQAHFPENQIFAIPNGLTIKTVWRNRENKKMTCLYLGNLQASKGIKDILDSFVLLKNGNIELQVVGQWRDEQTLNYCEELIRKNELNVIFHGPKYGDDKLDFLAKADLFLFTPNKPEGHPLVLIEAMAFGLPIISTNQGAISESVLENVNGFLVETNSPFQIAKKITFFIENPHFLKNFGEKSFEIYQKNYTAEKMVKNYENVFNSIIFES